MNNFLHLQKMYIWKPHSSIYFSNFIFFSFIQKEQQTLEEGWMCIWLRKPYGRTTNSYDKFCVSCHPSSGMGKVDTASNLQVKTHYLVPKWSVPTYIPVALWAMTLKMSMRINVTIRRCQRSWLVLTLFWSAKNHCVFHCWPGIYSCI